MANTDIAKSGTLPFQSPYTLGGCVYYAQNREDLVLLSFFAGEKDGFYIDVGAFHPDLDSVTKLFYKSGWRGINIEPQKDQYDLFVKKRQRDINLNLGISDHDDKLTLRAYSSGGLSTFSRELQKDYEQHPDEDTRSYVEHDVAVRPLKDVLAEQKPPHISFMKVDVEGLEYEVLSGNDWEKFRPEVICIEANHIQKDWRPLLRDNGYRVIFNDGLNDYYVDERTDRAAKFNFVEEVVHDRGGGIRAEHYRLMTDLYGYGVDKTNHVDELARQLDEQKQAYEDRIADMIKNWNSIRFVGARLKHLLKQRAVRVGKK